MPSGRAFPGHSFSRQRKEPLYEEPLHLLRGEQEIRDPGTYLEVPLIGAGELFADR